MMKSGKSINHINQGSDNEEELKRLAPRLFGTGKENPFNAPEGYFDDLPKQVVHQIESLPDFEKVSKENPFAVPEGYFQSLTSIIQKRIVEEKGKRVTWNEWFPVIINRIFGNVRPSVSLAFATVALLLVFGIKFLNRTIDVTYQPLITTTELTSSGYLSEIDESTIVEELEPHSFAMAKTSDKSVEDYLINNDVDMNSIADQL